MDYWFINESSLILACYMIGFRFAILLVFLFSGFTFHYFTILRTLYSTYSSINYNHSSLLLLIICFLLFNLLKIVITCFRGEVKTRRISRTILLIPAMMKKLKSWKNWNKWWRGYLHCQNNNVLHSCHNFISFYTPWADIHAIAWVSWWSTVSILPSCVTFKVNTY